MFHGNTPIHRDWNDITIHDLGSKNGVLVNNKRIGKGKRLKDADQILLGAVRLTFVDPTAAILQTLEGLPAFARDEESVEASLADLDINKGGDEENTGASVPGIFDEDLDENSVAVPLESMSASPSSEDNEELSSVNTMLNQDQEYKDNEAKAQLENETSGLGTAEKSLIALSALVFIGLIVMLLVFTLTD